MEEIQKSKKPLYSILLLIFLLLIGISAIFLYKNIHYKKNVQPQEESQKLIKENQEQEDVEKQKNIDNQLAEQVGTAREEFFNGNYEKAIKLCNDVISKDNDNYEAYNIRGITKGYDGDYQGGLQDINKALEINPNFAYGRFNKALNYELHGYYNDALTWYHKALELEEGAWTYYGIASIYGRRGDVKNTVEYLKKAINVDRSVIDHAKKEKDFNTVRKSKKFKALLK